MEGSTLLEDSQARRRCGFDLQRIGAETFVKACECHAELPSTNNRALELANLPELETPLLILALRQSAGRGRGENSWWSADGAWRSSAWSTLPDG